MRQMERTFIFASIALIMVAIVVIILTG